ncbi:MAG: PP2C family serine/threonine-protein phosphatase [Sandaracinaceae bacterium]
MSDDWSNQFADETLPVLRPREIRRAPSGYAIDLAGRSHVGCVREQNEDSFLIADLGRWLDVIESSLPLHESQRRIPGPKGTLIMVADGMGGHGGGEVASSVAIDMIAQFALYAMPWAVRPDEHDETEILERMGDAMSHCQARLERVAVRKQMEELQPGTTLTVAYALWPRLYVAHVGDTRLYLSRGAELTQITRDHTVGQALRDSGAIGSEPSRFDHILVNVVGGGGDRVLADAHALGLEPGDRVLMCSDGLYGHVTDAEIASALADHGTSSAASERLIQMAIDGGGSDNVTVLVAGF